MGDRIVIIELDENKAIVTRITFASTSITFT